MFTGMKSSFDFHTNIYFFIQYKSDAKSYNTYWLSSVKWTIVWQYTCLRVAPGPNEIIFLSFNLHQGSWKHFLIPLRNQRRMLCKIKHCIFASEIFCLKSMTMIIIFMNFLCSMMWRLISWEFYENNIQLVDFLAQYIRSANAQEVESSNHILLKSNLSESSMKFGQIMNGSW